MQSFNKKNVISLLVMSLITLFLGLSHSQAVSAATLPNSPKTFYYDESNLLTSATKKLVVNKNEVYKTKKAQPQVVLAVVKSIDGDDIDSYAPDLFKKWGIGQKGSDNGILILYALNHGDRNVRIEVGYGLEGAVTDAQAGQILRNNSQDLKSSNKTKVNVGLQHVFNAVVTLVDKEYGYKGDKNSLTSQEIDEINHPRRVGLPNALVIGLIIFVIIAVVSSIGGRRGGPRGPGSSSGGGFPWWLFWLGSGSRTFRDDDDGDDHWGGFGGFGGGSGGGFSGGGGSSGGGGASI